ncbi:TetR/AcrR family transcriptional regulator [Pseudonocardia sp. TRM90224]|uniref:TetR/AcrR family transcriptional regulator n=1 Tax=Pseudonocardia sp. TRM90224 TaxID=2812678 RepID=UPI001E5D73C0|nr:TetR/AcrR family transcriptional regulator [Pseudonocardia sp. TRM90224]
MRPEIQPDGQRPRSFIEEARRAQIIEAAVEVIADVGFAGASLALIAKHAGISKGVISYHFAGKDELMEKTVEHVYGDIGTSVLAGMEGAETGTALVRAHITGVAAYMRGHRTQLMALGEIFRNLRKPDGMPRFGVEANEPVFMSIEDIYRFGQRTGEFRDFDPRVMAVSHSAAVDGMFAYWSARPEHDLEAHAAQLAEAFVRAARAETSEGGTT